MKQGLTPSTGPRLRWRVVIHPGEKLDSSRGQQSLAWHLATCADPRNPEAHCDVGRRLMATDGNPDGHCLMSGACPRCQEAAAAEVAPAAEPQQPTAEPQQSAAEPQQPPSESSEPA